MSACFFLSANGQFALHLLESLCFTTHPDCSCSVLMTSYRHTPNEGFHIEKDKTKKTRARHTAEIGQKKSSNTNNKNKLQIQSASIEAWACCDRGYIFSLSPLSVLSVKTTLQMTRFRDVQQTIIMATV